VITVEGYEAWYNRTVKDLHIVNNTIINNDVNGRAVRIWSGTQNVALVNNLYVAPELFIGPHGTALVDIRANNLNGFSTIEDNIWADADVMAWADGVVWVGTGEGNSGFHSKSEWLNYGQVRDDRFENVQLNQEFKPTGGAATTIGSEYAGVFTDFHGRWRDGEGSRAAGAVEV
jgi:hypothetical protein